MWTTQTLNRPGSTSLTLSLQSLAFVVLPLLLTFLFFSSWPSPLALGTAGVCSWKVSRFRPDTINFNKHIQLFRFGQQRQ